MAIGVAEGIAGLGLIGNYLGGRSAANSQKEMSRRQAQLIGKQTELYNQTSPMYNQLLQEYARRAGIGPGADYSQEYGQAMSRGVNPMTGNATTTYRPGPNDGLLPEDRARLQAAEEDINRQARYGSNQLRFNQGLQGLNQGAQAAAQTRLQSEAARGYSNFRRGLAMDAGARQDQRLQQLQGALGFGLGQGSQAAGGYGNQAAMYGNQAQQAYSGIGDIVQQYNYGQNLRKYGQQDGGYNPRMDGRRRAG